MIPLTDLGEQHLLLRAELAAAVQSVLDKQDFILGGRVHEFEQAVGALLGADSAVGVSSGTDALLLSLLAEGVGPGDEVITTALTFVATAEAIARVGATPVFVDVDPRSLCLDPDAVSAAITARTRAILPVHLFGQAAETARLGELARRHELILIEDAAQAFGAKAEGQFVGTHGHYGALSFFPAKILGGAGDGGMVLCSGARAERIRALRLHGSRDKQTFELLGGNFRLDAIQAAILSVKLPHVLDWVRRRRAAAAVYIEGFRAGGLDALLSSALEMPGKEHAYNHFVVRAEERASLRAFLAAREIASAAYYATPLHLQPCFAGLGYRPGQLPQTEEASRTLLALPLYPELSHSQIERIVGTIAEHTARP